MKVDELDARRAEAKELRFQLATKEAEAAQADAVRLRDAFASEWEALCAKYEVDPAKARLDYRTFELTVI